MPRVYVVAEARARRADRVWVHWLGLPTTSHTWRSLNDHLLSDTDALPGIGAPKLHVDVQPAAPEHGALPLLQGAAPSRLRIHSFPRPPKRSAPMRKPKPKPKKKRSQAQYQRRPTHVIRVASDNSTYEVLESHGASTAGVGVVVEAALENSPTSETVETVHEGCGKEALGGGSSSLFDFDPGAPLSESAAAPSAAAPALERSQERCEADELRGGAPPPRRASIVIETYSADSVTLRWELQHYADSASETPAWIGMYDSGAFDWAIGEPRPPCLRSRPLTPSKLTGSTCFTAEDFRGLTRGDYLFSIDTASLDGSETTSTARDLYCVSQRLRLLDGEKVERLVGTPHACVNLVPVRPESTRRLLPPSMGENPEGGSDKDDVSDSTCSVAAGESSPRELLFPVPFIEFDAIKKETSPGIQRSYALVDRLSHLSWGLGSRELPAAAKRVPSEDPSLADGGHRALVAPYMAEAARVGGETGESGRPTGQPVPGCLLGVGARVPSKEELTASTSEGYGEVTLNTSARVLRTLQNLTSFVPVMAQWGDEWNLDTNATFVDIGSGYGKMPIHAKLATGCRSAHGIECVPKRVEISALALQGLYGELDRAALDDDLLSGVSFVCADAAQASEFRQSHLFSFDRIFSAITMKSLAEVLQRSPFRVLVSTRSPRIWWRYGLTKVQPVAKLRLKSTGREAFTGFIYVNTHQMPAVRGASTAV